MSRTGNEQADYVIHNYPGLLTPEETRAVRTLWGLAKSANGKSMRSHLRARGAVADADPEVALLLAEGAEAFYAGLVRRVRAECPTVQWIECSACGGLARTPRAKQCLHCGHDWH